MQLKGQGTRKRTAIDVNSYGAVTRIGKAGH